MYVSFRGIQVDFIKSTTDFIMEWKVQKIQVDNQLPDSRFPVLFFPDLDFAMRNMVEHRPFFYGFLYRQNQPGKFELQT
jgi:hypothetical protein